MKRLKATLSFLFFLCILNNCFVNAVQRVDHYLQRSILHRDERTRAQCFKMKLDKQEHSNRKKRNFLNLLQETNHFLIRDWEPQFLELPTNSHAYHINLKNILNTQYVGQLGIGDAANTFDVIFDTGFLRVFHFVYLCRES